MTQKMSFEPIQVTEDHIAAGEILVDQFYKMKLASQKMIDEGESSISGETASEMQKEFEMLALGNPILKELFKPTAGERLSGLMRGEPVVVSIDTLAKAKNLALNNVSMIALIATSDWMINLKKAFKDKPDELPPIEEVQQFAYTEMMRLAPIYPNSKDISGLVDPNHTEEDCEHCGHKDECDEYNQKRLGLDGARAN